jgi:RND family efflux transporter MFP subunit
VKHKHSDQLSRKQWLFVVLVVAALIIWIGFYAAARIQKSVQPPPPEPAGPLAVEVLNLEPATFTHWLRYPGTVSAENHIILQSRITSQILSMPIRSGGTVNPDEILIALDQTELQQELERLKAAARALQTERDLAGKQYQRLKLLIAKNAVSVERFEEVEARVHILQATMEENRQAQEVVTTRLGYATLTAPFAATVGQLFAQPGDMAAPGRPLLELIDPNNLKFVFTIPQQDMSAITTGLPAHIHIPALKRDVEGLLDRLHPGLQQPARAAQAEIVLTQHIPQLRPGMDAWIRLLIEELSEALIIPLEALHGDGSDPHVFVLDQGTARRHAVVTGPRSAQTVVITSGLQAGAQVIVTPHPQLADGLAVFGANQ